MCDVIAAIYVFTLMITISPVDRIQSAAFFI